MLKRQTNMQIGSGIEFYDFPLTTAQFHLWTTKGEMLQSQLLSTTKMTMSKCICTLRRISNLFVMSDDNLAVSTHTSDLSLLTSPEQASHQKKQAQAARSLEQIHSICTPAATIAVGKGRRF
jgi:hypothetical protein